MVRLFLVFGVLAFIPAFGQNTITVSNAASLGAGVPANTVAPGSLVTVQILRGGPVVINPDLTQVTLKVRLHNGSAEFDAALLQALAGSYLALVPQNLQPGNEYDFVLTVQGQTSLPVTLMVGASAPGLFAGGRFGLGPALAHNDGPDTPPRLNRFTDPARPGDYLTLWGTGLGNAKTPDVVVEIAGKPVPVSYAGPSPYQGLDQINVSVPAGTPESCFVGVQIRIGESVSNQTTFANAGAQGVCKDPFGLTEAELRALDDGRTVRLGVVSLRSEVLPDAGSPLSLAYSRNEAFSGEFAPRDAEEFTVLAQPLEGDPSYFSCRLQNLATVARFVLSGDFDAGDSLHLIGPGKSMEVPHQGVPFLYLNVIPPKDPRESPFFTAGTWTFTAPGGRTTGPFQGALELPPPLRWLNRESLLAINPANDQRVTWAPDGYTADDVMMVTLTSATSSQAPAAAVMCRAPASEGQVTIPAALMAKLARIPLARLQLRLAPRPERRVRFDFPLTAGGTAHGVYDYYFTDSLVVSLR